MEFDLVIVGGGLASARAIKAFRESGGEGSIALVSADVDPPYHRPPLSKRYLRGEAERDSVFVEAADFYGDVTVLLGRTATGLADGEVELEGGERLRYGKLLVASGATPRRLDVPGGERILYLRTLTDSGRIKEAAAGAATAVVAGAGFIGMEVTASLTQLGVQVSQVHLGRGLYDQFQSDELSARLADLYRERGVELVLEDSIERIDEEQAVTAAGRMLPADVIVAGVGVAPSTGWLEGSGVELDDGVVVNERFEASLPGVYAAGDVARFYDPLFARRRRIEHWSNANYQGTEVGKVLAGAGAGYDTVSAFFTEVFGITIRVLGEVTGDLRGTRYHEDGRVVGALLVDPGDEEQAAAREEIRSAR
jgi:3-phenylpropionate/trans-cinnamate dioxygenase ferredoxin reductase component